MKICHILFCFFVLGFAVATSAQDFFARKTAPAGASAETPRENARAELLLQQMERLAGQVDTLRQDYARIEQRATQLEQRATQAEQRAAQVAEQQRTIAALQDENTKLRDSVQALRGELTQVKADRETLRKQITDDLATRINTAIAAAVEKQNASRPGTTTGAGKETGRLHVVEAGQTLSEIATAYKSTVAVIMKANNITNANQLRIGQELFIPD